MYEFWVYSGSVMWVWDTKTTQLFCPLQKGKEHGLVNVLEYCQNHLYDSSEKGNFSLTFCLTISFTFFSDVVYFLTKPLIFFQSFKCSISKQKRVKSTLSSSFWWKWGSNWFKLLREQPPLYDCPPCVKCGQKTIEKWVEAIKWMEVWSVLIFKRLLKGPHIGNSHIHPERWVSGCPPRVCITHYTLPFPHTHTLRSVNRVLWADRMQNWLAPQQLKSLRRLCVTCYFLPQ